MKRVGVMVLVSLWLASCSGSGPGPAEEQVEGFGIIGSWSIDQVYLNGAPEGLIGPDWGKPPVIRFNSDGSFWGNAPCNDYQAMYEYGGSAIEITYMSKSAVLCGDEAMEKDELLLQVFRFGSIDVAVVDQGSGMEWTFDDGRVVLTRLDG